MPNKGLYESCVDIWYKIEPIDIFHIGEYVDGEKGCYTGPKHYRAPGYFQGTGLTLALPVFANWRFEVESVYDFASFEHSYFINGTDQLPFIPGIGVSDFVWGGALDQYAGMVFGFKTNSSIKRDYSGPAFTFFAGGSVGPAGIDPLGPSVGVGSSGFISLTDPRIRGVGIYVSIGFGVDAFPVVIDAGVGLISMTNFLITTDYKRGNYSVRKAQLFFDIVSGKHNVWLRGFDPGMYASLPSRAAIASTALYYAQVYEEINDGYK